jgi:predicted GNAT family acetyltransferase
MDGMRCVTDPDVQAFAEHALPWLLRDPVRHNALCTLVQIRVDEGAEPDALWVRVVDQVDEIVGVAVRTPPRGLLLSGMSRAAAQLVADHVATVEDIPVPAIEGPREPARAFVERYRERLGVTATAGLRTTMYRLDRVEPALGVPGKLREAGPEDRALIVRWVREFSAEAVPHQEQTDPAPQVDRRLSQGGMLWLWEDAGEPVSFLWLSAPAAGVVRISAVYTPPEARGHGYASACVAEVSQRTLDNGARTMMLYADTANRTSNSIYVRIGFEPLEEGEEWLFTRP